MPISFTEHSTPEQFWQEMNAAAALLNLVEAQLGGAGLAQLIADLSQRVDALDGKVTAINTIIPGATTTPIGTNTGSATPPYTGSLWQAIATASLSGSNHPGQGGGSAPIGTDNGNSLDDPNNGSGGNPINRIF